MRANCALLISYNVHWISMVSTWESSKSWRVCDQIETLGTDMLPNVNDHATKLTLFDKDFHVPRLPILTRKKKGQSIFSLLCFHEALELVEVSNSILAILFKN